MQARAPGQRTAVVLAMEKLLAAQQGRVFVEEEPAAIPTVTAASGYEQQQQQQQQYLAYQPALDTAAASEEMGEGAELYGDARGRRQPFVFHSLVRFTEWLETTSLVKSRETFAASPSELSRDRDQIRYICWNHETTELRPQRTQATGGEYRGDEGDGARLNGCVLWFDRAKQYGFIALASGQSRVGIRTRSC